MTYYIVKSEKKIQSTHGGTISNSENGSLVYIYSSYVMHTFSDFSITWWLYLLHQFI